MNNAIIKAEILVLYPIINNIGNRISRISEGKNNISGTPYSSIYIIVSSWKKNFLIPSIKNKIEKANKRYQKALEYLIKSNKEKPTQSDTLNYLGFATRKLGDYEKGEEYYLLGLQIDPDHKGINEYLGELYVVTGRIDLAKERLSVLKNCNCEEYKELKEIIEGKKQSKY